jgi:hypothetical protein
MVASRPRRDSSQERDRCDSSLVAEAYAVWTYCVIMQGSHHELGPFHSDDCSARVSKWLTVPKHRASVPLDAPRHRCSGAIRRDRLAVRRCFVH